MQMEIRIDLNKCILHKIISKNFSFKKNENKITVKQLK